MKPGDHPEFFRLPPPPGASRDSTIVLHRDGSFTHDGEPVEKRALAEAMHRWLSTHPDDGRFILTNGYDWCYLVVEDTPYFVRGLAGAPPAAPSLALSDGTEEPLDPASIAVDGDGVFFAKVKDKRFEARFLRHAQVELGSWLEEAEGESRLVIGGASHPLRARGQ